MTIKRDILLAVIVGMLFAVSSCAPKEPPIQVSKGEPLVYLKVEAAEASSYDKTPDWAPRPDPMAPVDGDMLTRWSSDLGLDDQWISFDFGKPKVASKIIITWEQAYAVDYEILASQDGKAWKKIVEKKDGKGGVEELSFAPKMARFVKIVGTKRYNPDWGISMWEVEFFGPQSLNPGDKTTAEDYLKKEELEKKKKELKKLLAEKAATLGPLTKEEFHKGVIYTSWAADEFLNIASDFTLIHLHSAGVRHLAVMVPAYQENIRSVMVYTNDKEGGDTPTDEAIRHVIKTAHSLGMKVMLKPHVDPRTGEPRMDIMGSDAWFDSYKKYILRYARLAEDTKCEIYAVGTELESTTMPRWEERWRDIIKAVKGVYSGALTYSANWTEYKEVPFWDEMDYIGIDAYFPLTKSNEPAMEELVAGWEKHADEIEKWLAEKGLLDKGVLFTELGYSSVDGTNKNPWTQLRDVEDQEEQAECLEAAFSVLSKRKWFKGVYLWQYFPQDRWSPLGFTIKGKKVEGVVIDWFGKID